MARCPQQARGLYLGKVTREEVDSLEDLDACSVSTLLQNNTWLLTLPVDNNQFLCSEHLPYVRHRTGHFTHIIPCRLLRPFSYSHTLEDETEAQRGSMICPKSPSVDKEAEQEMHQTVASSAQRILLKAAPSSSHPLQSFLDSKGEVRGQGEGEPWWGEWRDVGDGADPQVGPGTSTSRELSPSHPTASLPNKPS